MNQIIPTPGDPDDELDEHLALLLVTDFHRLEQALIRAGFYRVRGASLNARADWVAFARHIEGHFDYCDSPDVEDAVSYLLCDLENQELRQDRLQGCIPGEDDDASSDIVWLSEIVQEAGRTLSHQIGLGKPAAYDTAYLTAVQFVLDAWLHFDPGIESMLVHGH